MTPSRPTLGCPSPGPAPLPAPGDHPSLWVSLRLHFQGGWEASARHEFQRLWCCQHEAHMSPQCVACSRLPQRGVTAGCTVLLPACALCCTDQAQQKATAPLLKEKVSSMESQPKSKHAGWRQSWGNLSGWDMQTSVPRLTAVETEQSNINEANSDWKSGQEMSGRNP